MSTTSPATAPAISQAFSPTISPTMTAEAPSWWPQEDTVPRALPSWLAPPHVFKSSPPQARSSNLRSTIDDDMSDDQHADRDSGAGISAHPSSNDSLPPSQSADEMFRAITESHQRAVDAMGGEIESLQQALTNMAVSLARVRRDVLEASERDLVQLAVAIAERVVRRELQVDPPLIARWAREGIDALASKDELVIAVAPDIADKISPEAWRQIAGCDCTVQVDAALAPAQCEVRGKYSRVDASVEARLAAVVETLGVVTDGDTESGASGASGAMDSERGVGVGGERGE